MGSAHESLTGTTPSTKIRGKPSSTYILTHLDMTTVGTPFSGNNGHVTNYRWALGADKRGPL